MRIILYDSRDLRCKSPFGALATNETCTFRVSLPIAYLLTNPVLTIYRADAWDTPAFRLPMTFEDSDGVGSSYTATFSTSTPELFFYCFEVKGVNGLLYIYRDIDGFGVLGEEKRALWQLTVYDAHMRQPNFLKEGIFYQIFPDRFAYSGQEKENVPQDRVLHRFWGEMPVYKVDAFGKYHNNDYFGGDLAGITEKLPYLKSLGVRCLYLNPIFEAHSNHRYNTADYFKIDPLLGTEEDFRELCSAAKHMGMSILLDGVFNHAGSDSIYFNKEGRYGEHVGAYRDPESHYRDMFAFVDYPMQYSSWWGFESLPDFREESDAYQDMICGENGVVRYWLRAGASGWRLDVADELTDRTLDGIHGAARAEKPDALVLGEVWEDASTKFAYGQRRHYLLGKQLDSVMNYPFKDAIIEYVRNGNANQLYTTIMSILENYPQPVIESLMNSLSTHDVERALTALAGEPSSGRGRDWQGQHHQLSPRRMALGKKLLRLASVLQYTLPGIPCLYYGDEAGLFGYKDPFNRTCYPWGMEDTELLELFRELGALRLRFPKLAKPGFRAVEFGEKVVSYVREWEDECLFVAVNRTEENLPLNIPNSFHDCETVLGNVYDGRIQGMSAVVLRSCKC